MHAVAGMDHAYAADLWRLIRILAGLTAIGIFVGRWWLAPENGGTPPRSVLSTPGRRALAFGLGAWWGSAVVLAARPYSLVPKSPGLTAHQGCLLSAACSWARSDPAAWHLMLMAGAIAAATAFAIGDGGSMATRLGGLVSVWLGIGLALAPGGRPGVWPGSGTEMGGIVATLAGALLILPRSRLALAESLAAYWAISAAPAIHDAFLRPGGITALTAAVSVLLALAWWRARAGRPGTALLAISALWVATAGWSAVTAPGAHLDPGPAPILLLLAALARFGEPSPKTPVPSPRGTGAP